MGTTVPGGSGCRTPTLLGEKNHDYVYYTMEHKNDLFKSSTIFPCFSKIGSATRHTYFVAIIMYHPYFFNLCLSCISVVMVGSFTNTLCCGSR